MRNSSGTKGVLIRERPLNHSVLLAIFILFSFSLNGYSKTIGSNKTWTLVWQDNFDGPAGQLPDVNRWDYDIGTDWGNAQLEYDTDRPSNVSLDGEGNLAIIAREESYMGQPYTSARIVTRDLCEFSYGRVEARIKLPTGQGIWPAFWLLGANIATIGWPLCGEIDIMEYLGHQTNMVYGSLHGPGYSGGGAFSQAYILENGSFDTAFHVFAVEWETDVIRWYVDDILYSTIGSEDLGGNEWVFDHPFYIILNVAVGGNWPGPPDGSTVFPQTMLIDYVRVQNATFEGSCCDTPGDANDDGIVNVSDAVYIVNYIFMGGQEPLCLEEGDANCDATVNVSDAVYIINYIFTGGPPPCCPDNNSVVVFDDDYGEGVWYEAFSGSFPGAVQVEQDSIYAGTQGLEITIPGTDPWWSGGAFTGLESYDLSSFNALTFWAKASVEATIDIAGIGNDNTGTSKYIADVTDLALTTSWQKYVIPIPLAEKMIAEQGLFYFAEGEGIEYQIWIDEIVYENLATISNPRPAIATQTIVIDPGAIIEVDNGIVTFDVDGTDIDVSAMPGYFTFISSDPSVVSVGGAGTIMAVGEGTATLTAQLGEVAATGEITVYVNPGEAVPQSSAPIPAVHPDSVISLFSDAYTDHPVDTWSAPWDIADVEDYSIGSDNTKKYTNLVYAGIEFAVTTVDASTMTHIHLDVWTPDPTSAPNEFKVKLVDFGADGIYGGGDDVEHELTFDESTMSSKAWISIDVPLTDFTNLITTDHLAQMIISSVGLSNVYVDNIYFYESSGSTEPTTSAPAPTDALIDVISVYSDVYPSIDFDTWSSQWDNADVADFTIGPDNLKKYYNLVFSIAEYTTSGTLDLSTMTHFHIDVWTPISTGASSEFKIKLVDYWANGVWDGVGDDVEHELIFNNTTMSTGNWISFDIPLSDFSGMTTTAHFAQLILSGTYVTVFIDNIYFHK